MCFKNINFGKSDKMLSSNQHTNLADYYFGFLKNLNPDSKLDLISKLSLSLKENEATTETSLQSIFGAYQSNDSAEEIIAEIRTSRTSNRNIEQL